MRKVGQQINVLAKKRQVDPNRLRALFALERLVARLENSINWFYKRKPRYF